MFYQIFLSPQVKRWAIVTYKFGIYELPYELSNDFSRCTLFHMKTRVSLKYSVGYCLWEPFFDFNSSQTPSNLISLTFLVTLRSSTLF